MARDFRLGIVGAGIAGSSAAFFARDRFPTASITILERSDRIGGKVRSIPFSGQVIETGAGFIHSSNQLLSEFVTRLQLSTGHQHGSEHKDLIPIAIWNGHRFVITITSRRISSLLPIVGRYGASLLRLRRFATRALDRWTQVYAALNRGTAFASVDELLAALDLSDLARVTCASALATRHVGRRAADDLASSMTRAIFNRDLSLNGFAGAVALIAAGAAGGRTFSIEGGNSRLCEALIRDSHAEVHLDTEVGNIRPAGPWNVQVAAGASTHNFDAVIVAAPNATRLISGEPESSSQNHGTQMDTFVTAVVGVLAGDYFGLPRSTVLPRFVLSTSNPEIPFSTILCSGQSLLLGQSIYKIQSSGPLGTDLLRTLFSVVSEVQVVRWSTHHELFSESAVSRFSMDDGVYNAGALDCTLSTLESQVVASKNVVGLLGHAWSRSRGNANTRRS